MKHFPVTIYVYIYANPTMFSMATQIVDHSRAANRIKQILHAYYDHN